MRQMLVAVDGSDNAFRALDFAASFAQRGAPLLLHLLYVYDDISFGDRSHAFHSNEELERPERERGMAILKSAAERVAPSGVQIAPALVMGDIAETIVSQAEKLGCHSIVMGMKEQSVIAGLVLGSTTMTVLHTTKLPVMLVK
jgi:nucleotide-binding universal stress UspA family protein